MAVNDFMALSKEWGFKQVVAVVFGNALIYSYFYLVGSGPENLNSCPKSFKKYFTNDLFPYIFGQYAQ